MGVRVGLQDGRRDPPPPWPRGVSSLAITALFRVTRRTDTSCQHSLCKCETLGKLLPVFHGLQEKACSP